MFLISFDRFWNCWLAEVKCVIFSKPSKGKSWMQRYIYNVKQCLQRVGPHFTCNSFQVFQYFFIQNKTLKKKKKTLKGSLILEAILNYLYINLCNYVADGHIWSFFFFFFGYWLYWKFSISGILLLGLFLLHHKRNWII